MTYNNLVARVKGDTAAQLLRIAELTGWELAEVLAYVLETGIERGPWASGDLADALPAAPKDVDVRVQEDIRVHDLVVDPDFDVCIVVKILDPDERGEVYAELATGWEWLGEPKNSELQVDVDTMFSAPIGLLSLAVLLP